VPGKDAEKLEPSNIPGGNVKCAAVLAVTQKVKHMTQQSPS